MHQRITKKPSPPPRHYKKGGAFWKTCTRNLQTGTRNHKQEQNHCYNPSYAAPQSLWICSSWPLMELVAPDSVNGRLMQLCLCGTHIVCASGSIKKEPDQLLPIQSRDSAQSRLSVNQQHWSISRQTLSRAHLYCDLFPFSTTHTNH